MEQSKVEKNEFDRFIEKHVDILKPILVSDLAAQKSYSESNMSDGWHNRIVDNMTPLQRTLYFAKKNGKCLIEAEKNHFAALEKSKEHGKKIVQSTIKPTASTRIKTNLMPLLEAKTKLWNMYLKDSFAPAKFVVDDDNREVLEQLTKYFIRDESCEFDLKKGIALVGGVGTGKTNLMKQISYFCKDNNLETAFNLKDMEQFVAEVGTFGLSAENKYFTSNYCFDDIAIGNKEVNYYGTKTNPLGDLIHGTYLRYTRRVSKPTHFTMNINFDPTDEVERQKLAEIYDIRWIDRLREMCNFVYLGGGSRRK